jgi:DnaJ-class molecular chaperone
MLPWPKIAVVLAAWVVVAMFVRAAKDLYGMFDMKRTSFNKDLLNKRMKKLVLKYHPDKNKSPDASQRLLEYREAFEILEDDQKRAIYDAHGYEAAKNAGQGQPPPGHGAGGFGGFDASDLFERFFGGGARGHHRPATPRTPDANLELHISLEDAYKGRKHRLQLPRTVLCKHCKGLGAQSPKDVQECSACHGSGMRTFYRQFGPGMVQQVRAACETCQGRGRTFKTKCHTCHGNKVERITQDLDLTIDPGVLDGTSVKFPKLADEAPEHDTGDLFVVLKVDPHARFRRDGANLHTKLTISLKEVCMH